MAKRKKKSSVSDSISEYVFKGIQEKKGNRITCLNMKNIGNAVADYFIICHGTSSTQVDAIARSVEEEVRKSAGIKPWHKEGFQNSEWVLLDYVDVVVHIFQEKTRDFYQIENLWADAEITQIEND